MIEQFYDLRPEVLALDRKALDLCRAQFAHVEEIRDYNQLKMLRAFTDCGVEARHFWGSSGYGGWADSRNKRSLPAAWGPRPPSCARSL